MSDGDPYLQWCEERDDYEQRQAEHDIGYCNKCGYVGPTRDANIPGGRACGNPDCNYLVPTAPNSRPTAEGE